MPHLAMSCLRQAALLLVAAFALSACQTLPNANESVREEMLSASDALFGDSPVIPKSRALHVLSKEGQAEFLQYFHDPERARIPGFRRVANYLGVVMEGFEYRTDTYSAAVTLSSKSGNCLSLAIMTTALAQLADVDVAYQLMNSDPVFNFHGTIVEKGVHVRTLLLNSDNQSERGRSDVVPGIAIDFFPTERERFVRNMKRGEYEAMYFRNIANEALRFNDLNSAYWYARESLNYDAQSSEALNTLAIVNRRAGYLESAEAIYLFALEHADEKLTLLKNYRVLLVASDRLEEAQQIDEQLQGMEDPSPNNWFQLARSAFDDHDYGRAVDYYQRVLTLAPYLNDARLELAKSYLELGYSEKALESLLGAIENAGNRQDRKFYKSKLAAFKYWGS